MSIAENRRARFDYQIEERFEAGVVLTGWEIKAIRAGHQTHHRGQAHAMLSATTVAPPQLDEFLMPSDAHFRSADMAALGWSEAEVYRG